MYRNRITAVLLAAICVIFYGCMPFQPVYSNLLVPKEKIKSLQKILLVGPVFSTVDAADEAWIKETRDVWQKEIAEIWAKYRQKDGTLFEIITPNNAHYDMLNKLLAEQRLNEVPKFDTKTGQINKEYEERVAMAYRNLAQKAGVDAVLISDFVMLSVKNVKHNQAFWDGVMEVVAKATIGRMFAGGTVSVEGEVPALSLYVKLLDKDGNTLIEGRGGYKLLTDIKIGLTSDTNRIMDIKEAFGEKKYKNQRTRCINLALSPLANPKDNEGKK